MAIHANVDRDVLTRIRMEYIEMPGLRLTSSQASRLWNLEPTACSAILAALIEDQFLSQTSDGAYIRISGGSQFLSERARARHVD